MAPWPTESTRIWASVARSSASLMGQPLPHERGRGRVRWGNREVPPATLEGGTRGKRSFPPRERAEGERRGSWSRLEHAGNDPVDLAGGTRGLERFHVALGEPLVVVAKHLRRDELGLADDPVQRRVLGGEAE